MIHRILSRSLLSGLALTLALTGCVTGKDLTTLEGRLIEELQAMEARTQPQVGALQAELERVRGAQDSLREDLMQSLAAARSDTQAAQEAVKRGQASLDELKTVLQAEISQNRKALDQYAGQSAAALKQIAEHTKRASGEMQGFRREMMQSLLGSFRAEEAALRERLNAMVQTRKQLESLASTPAVEEQGSGRMSKETIVLEERDKRVGPLN